MSVFLQFIYTVAFFAPNNRHLLVTLVFMQNRTFPPYLSPLAKQDLVYSSKVDLAKHSIKAL